MDFGIENFHIIPPDKPGTEKDVLQRRQKAVLTEARTRVTCLRSRRPNQSASEATRQYKLNGNY